MAEFFEASPGIEQSACDRYAEMVVGSTVRPLFWQGSHSYTVESNDGRTVIQFRAARSPLDENTVKLAKKIHPNLVPAMDRLYSFDDPSVSVWKMEKIHGDGFMIAMDINPEIKTMLTTTVVDMVEFYLQAWRSPQKPDSQRVIAARQECDTKLDQVANISSGSLLKHVNQIRDALDDIFRLPWVLSHDDLSGANVLVDPATGSLRGVVDWTDAPLWPFGVALYGLEESILGYCNDDGWLWLDEDPFTCQKLFSTTLKAGLDLPVDRLVTIEMARKLGLLFRHGFVWRDDGPVIKQNTTMLDLFLGYDLLGES